MSSLVAPAPGRTDRLRFGLGLFLACDGLFFFGLACLYPGLWAERPPLPGSSAAGASLVAWAAAATLWFAALLNRARSAAPHRGACIAVGFSVLLTMFLLSLLVPSGSVRQVPGSAVVLSVFTGAHAVHLCVAWFWTATILRRGPDGAAAELGGLFLLFVAGVGTVLAALPKLS